MIKYKNPLTGLWENLPFLIDGNGLPAITPEMFGAKGDGVTDDAEAIRTAILNCKPGGTLYFSNNTYAVSQTISIDKKINIEGRTCTIIPMDGFNPDTSVFTFTNQTAGFGTKVSGVLVSCQNRAKHGFRVTGRGSTQITFSECSVSGALSDGFIVEPMAYCIFFRNCTSSSNGGSGISVAATDSDNQINAVTIDGCTLVLNRKHGAHVSGVHIVVKNCIIELNGIYSIKEEDVLKYYYVDATNKTGSGVYVGVPGYASQNVVIQNNYFEPSADAQVTASSKYVSLRVLNNYFLSDTDRKPEVHSVTHVKCVHSGDEDSSVNLRFLNNTVAGTTRTDVDGGGVLDYFSQVNAQYVKNATVTELLYPPDKGTRYYMPVRMFDNGLWDENTSNQSKNLSDHVGEEFRFILPFPAYNALFRDLGLSAVTDGTSTAHFRVRVIDPENPDGENTKEGNFDLAIDKSGTFSGNLLNYLGYYNIPNRYLVEITFKLASLGTAKSVVISNPFIDIYNP